MELIEGKIAKRWKNGKEKMVLIAVRMEWDARGQEEIKSFSFERIKFLTL